MEPHSRQRRQIVNFLAVRQIELEMVLFVDPEPIFPPRPGGFDPLAIGVQEFVRWT